MSRLLVIGCGGVASVAIHKCCQNSSVFTELCIASRTISKCNELKEKLTGKTATKITTAQVDAADVPALTALIREYRPDAVLNVALPYQDLTIMDACLAAGVHYIDTANFEAENTDDPQWRSVYEKRCKELGFSAYFDYSWQWDYQEKFRQAGLTALLGSGFDPGVTSVFTAYALKHYFDEIHTIDILDCNGGDHAAANLMPLAAANRVGLETVEPCRENGGQSSALSFYGSSFITDGAGDLAASAGREEETVLTASFDLDVLEEERLNWGIFRDRRPECYQVISEK